MTSTTPSTEPAEVEAPAPAPAGKRPNFFGRPAAIVALEIATSTYAAAAIIIFLGGWLRTPIALAIIPCVVGALFVSSRRAVQWSRENALLSASSSEPAAVLPWSKALLIFLTVAFLVACTGVSGLTFQFYDYWNYDAHLKETIQMSWPMGVILDTPRPETKVPASIYWGYWLPAALVGRIAGWNAAYLFQYPWNVLGVLLAVIWFMRIVGTSKYRYALLFLFFGGLDFLGYAMVSPLPDGSELSWYDYFTGTYWWSIGRGWMAHWSSTYSLLMPEGNALSGGYFFRFFGLLSFLSDGPHHIIPAIVSILVVMHDALRRNTIERLFLLTSFFPISAIFATIGTLPVLALCSWHTRARGLFTFGNMIVGPLLVLGMASYYKAIESGLPSGFIWNYQNVFANWRAFALYYLCAFAIYALLAPTMRANGYRPGRAWFYTAIAVFLFAPWYRMGVFGDFTTKIVVPCQMIFLVCLATAIHQPEGFAAITRRNLLIVALVLGSWAGTGPVIRALDHGFGINIPPVERVALSMDSVNLAADTQLKVNEHSFFWKYLAKPIVYFRTPANPVVRDYDFQRESFDQWVYFAEATKTDAGAQIKTPANKPLLRKYELDLDPLTVGSILLRHSVVDSQGKVPKYRIYVQWASPEDIERNGDDWPFEPWHISQVYPPASPQQPIAYNPYWRGDIANMAFFFEVDGADPSEIYTVTVGNVMFFERAGTPALSASSLR